MRASGRFTLRTYHRIPFRCGLYYLGHFYLGKGTILNGSRTGMRVEGDHPVARDAVVAVRVLLPEDDQPVEIERAVVRWAQGTEFGLEFQSISPDAARRIAEFLSGQVDSYCAPWTRP